MTHTVASLIYTSVDDLASTIRCAVDTGRTIPIKTLREAMDKEYTSRGSRVSVIKLLNREIKRQELEGKKG